MKMYKHPEVNSLLTLKKLSGDVGTFNLIDLPKHINIKGNKVFQVIICHIENVKEVSVTDLSVFADAC